MNYVRWTFEAIGTVWHIDLPEITDELRRGIVGRVSALIETFDENYSRFREDSLVSEIARNAGTYILPDDAKPLFDLYFYLYQVTGEKFTPLIGQVLSDAGYDANYSFQLKELRVPPALEDVIEYDFPKLVVLQPVLLDLGAAGKGYLVDLVAELLDGSLPADSCFYTINAGGDIRVRMSNNAQDLQEGQAVRIGLENPDDPTQVIGIAELSNGTYASICGSAGNRRAWNAGGKEWHHTIDPHTLVSPRILKAVWVSANSTILADALTTCLYFVDPQILMQRLGAEYTFGFFILYADNSFEASPDFPAEIFLQQTSAV